MCHSFFKQGQSLSLLFARPVLATALIQMAALCGTAVQEQLFFESLCCFLFRAPITFCNHLSYSISFFFFFNFLPFVALYILLSSVSLTKHLVLLIRLWHPSLSVSAVHRLISLSGFSLVFTNTPQLLLETHTHAHTYTYNEYTCAHQHTQMSITSLVPHEV